jgi:hypothetical protein
MTPAKPVCFVPKPAPEREAEIYRRVLQVHCDRRGEPGHQCRGAVTIRQNSITLQCPLCGDARKVLP